MTQLDILSGSPVSADKPIGMFGGHQIMSIDRCCGDHGEQMLTPVRALGYEYVAAPHADRKPPPDVRVYRLYGAVDGTALEYDPPGVGPATIDQGQQIEIRTLLRVADANHGSAARQIEGGAQAPRVAANDVERDEARVQAGGFEQRREVRPFHAA